MFPATLVEIPQTVVTAMKQTSPGGVRAERAKKDKTTTTPPIKDEKIIALQFLFFSTGVEFSYVKEVA